MKENNARGAMNFPQPMGKVNSDARPYPMLHKSDVSQSNLIYKNLQEVGQGIAEPSFGEQIQ